MARWCIAHFHPGTLCASCSRWVPELCAKTANILRLKHIRHPVLLEDGPWCAPALPAAGSWHWAAPRQSPADRRQALHAEQEMPDSAPNRPAQREVGLQPPLLTARNSNCWTNRTCVEAPVSCDKACIECLGQGRRETERRERERHGLCHAGECLSQRWQSGERLKLPCDSWKNSHRNVVQHITVTWSTPDESGFLCNQCKSSIYICACFHMLWRYYMRC